MRKLLDNVYAASLGLAAFFLVGIFAVMVSEAVLRTMGSYITGASELVAWFCAAAGFMALPATFKRGDMVRVGVVVDALPPTIRKPMLLACLALAAVFVGYLLKALVVYLWHGWRSEEVTQGMIEIATWIPQVSFLLGVTLLFIAIVDEFVVVARAPATSLQAERAMSTEDVSI